MKYSLLLLWWLCALPLLGKETPKYAMSELPKTLQAGVDAIVREKDVTVTVYSKSHHSIQTRRAVTILNAQAKNYAIQVLDYGSPLEIYAFRGAIYNASGELVRKMKKSDIHDGSAFDEYTLYSDNRVKSADLSFDQYPYTVEFEYYLDYRHVYNFEDFQPITAERLSVQHAQYQLIYEPEVAPRYKIINTGITPEAGETSDGKQTLTWTFENLTPITFEPYGPSYQAQLPAILTAPSLFSLGRYDGDMSTWAGYGKWKASLLTGLDDISENTRLKAVELTKGLHTTEEKAKVLYEYMQGKTRYVSLVLGMGGLKPYPASMIEDKGYGDCKALSNYMICLLQAVGITGYYTTIKSGRDEFELFEDFPSHQSNHVVVAVPNGADTLWLECTTQSGPFGYAGHFTGNRKAFMITPEGGTWVRTPRYTAQHNQQIRTADVVVDPTGNAVAKVATTYSGLQYENYGLDWAIDGQNHDEQKKWVQKNTGIPSFNVRTFSMTQQKEKIPSATVKLDLDLNRYATLSGKRVFLTPNIMNRLTVIPQKVENRKTKVVINFGHFDVDTVHYHVPENLSLEFVPTPVSVKSRFGEYDVQYLVYGRAITYIRRLRVNKGEYPPESYQEFVDFYRNVSKSDNTRLVFLSRT